VADQDVPEPVTVAVCPAIVIAGVWIVSSEVKVNVTVSPVLANELFGLFEETFIPDKVGVVLSNVIDELVLRGEPVFPAKSP